MAIERKYWPFPVLKPESEWDQDDLALIAFMKTAYEEGFRPYTDGQGSLIGAGDSSFREVALVFRGSRAGWEPWIVVERGANHQLGPRFSFEEHTCMVIRPFQAAARFAMAWLRGNNLDEILKDYVLIPVPERERRKPLVLKETVAT